MQNAEKSILDPYCLYQDRILMNLPRNSSRSLSSISRQREIQPIFIGRQKRAFGLRILGFERFAEIMNKRIATLELEVRDLAGEIFQVIHVDFANHQIAL